MAWSQYLAWNQAIADVIYPIAEDPGPAYMDLEDEELQKIAAAAGYAGADIRGELARVVRAVTSGSDGRFTLAQVIARTRGWAPGARKKRQAEPPPCLGFLAVTVLAAEAMGDDEDLAPNAYYARLARLLRLPDDDAALRKQYSQHAEYLWRCLNLWLENLDGTRGIPTAYALNYRFVGLPMSQALVRHHDRRKLPSMFAQYGLSAGMRLAPEDLIRYLDAWLTSEGTSATSNLRKLWNRPDTHERLASIAAIELANWDGSVGGDVTVSTTSVGPRALVVVNLRDGFMGESLDISFGLRPVNAEMDGAMEVRGADGRWLPLAFEPGTAGLWRTSYTEAIDFRSMLDGVVQIRHAGDDGGVTYRHLPRGVMPLVYDELQSAYVEAERLQLGVDALVLVRAEDRRGLQAVAEVESILNQFARPGFERVKSILGLPTGWVLFKDVQLFGAPTVSTSFNELVPIARNQLTIAGGLRIPSRMRKWSRLNPPEIRATAQSDSYLRITITGSLGEDQIGEWSSNAGALVVLLNDLALEEDDYQVALYCGSRKTPVQQATIRLRSSDNLDTQWSDAPRLTYSLESALGVLTAVEGAINGPFVDGLTASGDSGITATVRAGSTIAWGEPRAGAPTVKIEIGSPDPKSCVVTGAHRIQLPPAMGGWAPKFIEGECTSCGLVKRYPGWLPKYKKRRRGETQSADELPLIRVSELQQVADSDVNWAAALDALMHLGGGSISSLRSIAMQLEGSALFVDNFIQAMEVLGHIAVERDAYWNPVRWEVGPTCLGQQADGSFRLAGFWPPSLREQLEHFAVRHGGELITQRQEGSPDSVVVRNIDIELLDRFAQDAEVTIAPQAGWSILRTLPRISEVAAALPKAQMPGFQTAEKFDVASASWMPSGDAESPGAYRIRRGFETIYLYRSQADVDANSCAIAPVRMVKHLAANDQGTPLFAYSEKAQALLTPQGCDLPGLYGRALVALSGSLPSNKRLSIKGRYRNCLVYYAVDRDTADLLNTLLLT